MTDSEEPGFSSFSRLTLFLWPFLTNYSGVNLWCTGPDVLWQHQRRLTLYHCRSAAALWALIAVLGVKVVVCRAALPPWICLGLYIIFLRRYLVKPIETRNTSTNQRSIKCLSVERSSKWKKAACRNAEQEEEDEDEEVDGELRDCVYVSPAFPSTGSWASRGRSNRERCAISSRQDKGCLCRCAQTWEAGGPGCQ